VKVRVESAVRVHLRVTHVVSVGGGLAADRAGAWHRRRTPSGELNSNVTVATIVRQFDGAALLRALEAATARLEAGADEVNALNVYPVPDGDTGTNLTLTVRAVAEAVAAAEEADRPALARAVARAALMGARGNSGVILSQIVRGVADVLAEATNGDDPQLTARALRGASDAAFRRVGRLGDGWLASRVTDAADGRRAIEAIRRHAEEAGRDPAAIGLQSMVAPPPRDAEGKRFYAEPERVVTRAAELQRMGFQSISLNATAIFQAGARSVDAMADGLGALHTRLRKEIG